LPADRPIFDSASFRANPAPAGPTETIRLCDGRHGTGVWPEFRERPRPARTSALLTAGHRGTPGTRQVTCRYVQPWRLVHRRRRPSEGPVPDVRPEGVRSA